MFLNKLIDSLMYLLDSIPWIPLVYLWVGIEAEISNFLYKIYECVVSVSRDNHIYFPGCGILSAYQLGIAKFIQEKINIRDHKIYATSSGFVPAAALAHQIPADQLLIQICDSLDGEYVTSNQFYNAAVNVLRNRKPQHNMSVGMIRLGFISHYRWVHINQLSDRNRRRAYTAATSLPLERYRIGTAIETDHYISSFFLHSLVDFIKLVVLQFFRLFGFGVSDSKMFIHPFLWNIWSPLILYPFYSKQYIKKIYAQGYRDAQVYLKYFGLSQYSYVHKPN